MNTVVQMAVLSKGMALVAMFVLVASMVAGCGSAGRAGRGGGAVGGAWRCDPTRVHACEGGLLYRSVEVDGVLRAYAIYVPRGYSPASAWPCVVFLNGSGECGTDGQRQVTQGLLPAMLNAPQDWPMIAVFPQKPDRASLWADHDRLVLAALEQTRQELRVDADRIYLTGLSQGGAGTWAIGARHATLFAAIAPICGFGNSDDLHGALDGVPVWAFHGEKDDIVAIAHSERFIAEIARTSGRTPTINPAPGSSLTPGDPSSLRFTRFADLNHGSWDRAYREMELGEWLLSFRRSLRAN